MITPFSILCECEFSRDNGRTWAPMQRLLLMVVNGIISLPPPSSYQVYVLETLVFVDEMPRNDIIEAGMTVVDPETGEALLITRQL